MTKTELKNARLICKSLDQAAAPLLFDEVFIAATYSDLEIADLVASRFGSYIKNVTVSLVEYVYLSKTEFFSLGESERNSRTLERVSSHLEHALDIYRKARTEDLEIKESGELLARLCLILSKSPNIRNMVLTDFGNNDLHPTSQLHFHDLWKQDDLCPFKMCKLSVSDHVSFFVRPSPPYKTTPDPLRLAMLAISAAKSTITGLAVIHDGHHPFLSNYAFRTIALKSRRFTLQLQNLTKLRLRFSRDERQPPARHSDPDRVVGETLSVAVNLETLFIEGDFLDEANHPDSRSMVSGVLGGCRFPKLRSLILKMMDSREDELLEFLNTSPCLEHLMLECFPLNFGSWENMADKIRSALRLKSVILHILFGGFPNREWDDDYSFDRRRVEDFFLRNGENPFTEESMERWKDKDKSTELYASRDLDCQKYIQKFH